MLTHTWFHSYRSLIVILFLGERVDNFGNIEVIHVHVGSNPDIFRHPYNIISNLFTPRGKPWVNKCGSNMKPKYVTIQIHVRAIEQYCFSSGAVCFWQFYKMKFMTFPSVLNLELLGVKGLDCKKSCNLCWFLHFTLYTQYICDFIHIHHLLFVLTHLFKICIEFL